MDPKVIIPFKWLSKDGKLLLAARIMRTFAYGFLSVILAIYLNLIGFNDLYVGFILTATLVNSVIFTLIASFYADKLGRRKVLIVYSIFIIWLEPSMSAGILAAGLPQIFAQQYGLNQIESIKFLFILYSIIGLGVSWIYFLISSRVEVNRNNNSNSNYNATNTSTPFKQTLSPKSKEIVGKLSGLFAIDSFAGGFVIQSFYQIWS